MTDKEKAIVMAYTGKCMLTGDKFQIFYEYIEGIMGRPIMTHEIGFLEDMIKEKAKADFIALCKDESGSENLNRWIPCSERLPEVYGSNDEFSDNVLICVADDEQLTISTGFYGYYPNTKSLQGWWSMWAYGCHKLDSKYKVVAWMSLPEPYEEVEEEEN